MAAVEEVVAAAALAYCYDYDYYDYCYLVSFWLQLLLRWAHVQQHHHHLLPVAAVEYELLIDAAFPIYLVLCYYWMIDVDAWFYYIISEKECGELNVSIFPLYSSSFRVNRMGAFFVRCVYQPA